MIVLRTLVGTWANVREEVNKRRYEEYEAEEQRRVKAALNQAVNLSEMKLAQRTGHALSDEEMDDEMEGDEDESESDIGVGDEEEEEEDEDVSDVGDEADVDMSDDDDDDNMSSSEAEDNDDDAGGDADLTQEQLLAKYANLPPLDNDVDGGPDNDERGSDDDTSDESVDMDDDLGSSDGAELSESGEDWSEDDEDGDDDDGDDDDDNDDDDDDDGVDGQSGLLGLLFGKSELKRIKQEAPTVDEKQDEADPEQQHDADVARVSSSGATPGTTPGADWDRFVAGDEDDEVCLIPTGAATAKTTPHRSVPTSAAVSPLPMPNGVNFVNGVDGAGGVNGPADMVGPALSSPQAMDLDDSPGPGSPQSHPIDDVNNDHATPSDTAAPSYRITTVAKLESPAPMVPKTPIPFLLRGTLREYQHYGLDWLAGLYANRTNGILADEMGLGKTIQTIALLAHLACHHEVWGPHLVIVPTSVMLNWEMEFKKWCPGFKILAYYGSQDERKRKRQGWTNDDVWNVCITSYQLVLQDHQVFRRRRWHYMVLDEAHNIKNFKSQRWQTLLGFNAHSRLLLTGTPLQNNLTELWSLLFFLMPGEQEDQAEGFADLDEFRQWFARPETQILQSGREKMDDEARAIIAKLHQVLRPYLLRRLKADVERQMPAKYEHVELCRLSKRQRELYDGFLARTDTRETLASGNYLSIINCLMQLRKVCNHPDLFVDRPIMTSFRMPSSVPAQYAFTERLVRDRLLAPKPMTVVDLGFLNLVPARFEGMATTTVDRINALSAQRALNHHRDVQRARVGNVRPVPDGSTVHSVLAHFEWRARASRRHELQHNVYVSALRKQQKPMYGKNLVELLTVVSDARLRKPRPKVPRHVMAWFTNRQTDAVDDMLLTLDRRAQSCEGIIGKCACVTPAVVTGSDMVQMLLGTKGVQAFRDEDLRLSEPIRWAPFMPKERPYDPWHEARMRLSIQFPDKRLLQYDCGKLQVLDRLLRRLRGGGHRALIFTQMTKVLDILEQFLNMHGHKYLRLDGATKVEQRQILTDRFNHDSRILCFILSTRSGGLGINLTGADTVIFYDQDWNPAMDKQCQDRCHRIGQTRDVHIYRLISEHTIEANILRKASQKQILDDVVIREGEFTTDYFSRLSMRDVIGSADEDSGALGGSSAAADAVMDRLLGGTNSGGGSGGGRNNRRNVGKALEQAEDREDVVAANVAEKETQADEADFDEKPTGGREDAAAAAEQEEEEEEEEATPRPQDEQLLGADESGVDGDRRMGGTIDDYMLVLMGLLVEGTALELPRDRKKSRKRRRDTRKR